MTPEYHYDVIQFGDAPLANDLLSSFNSTRVHFTRRFRKLAIFDKVSSSSLGCVTAAAVIARILR